jgi:hypothetical protein
MTFLDTLPADQVLEALTSLEAIRIYVIILCVLFILMAVAIVFFQFHHHDLGRRRSRG